MRVSSAENRIQLCLFLALVANILLWFVLRGEQSIWSNVPPVPEQKFASAYGLGDYSLAYRVNGLNLQHLGDAGGRVTPLENYDYEALGRWFLLQDHLDSKSDFTPYLAAYYFGAVQDPQMLGPVIDYLYQVGKLPYANKWRWLAQGVYLARFRMKDYDRAFALAHILAQMDIKGAPGWVKQMPAFVKNQSGEKEAAYALMLEILKSSGDELHPTEVYSMRVYMCTRLLEKEDASKNPLCEGL